jgi:hypothetical protein
MPMTDSERLTAEEELALEQLVQLQAGVAEDWGAVELSKLEKKEAVKVETLDERKRRLEGEYESAKRQLEQIDAELTSAEDEEEEGYLENVRECADALKKRGVDIVDLTYYLERVKLGTATSIAVWPVKKF